MAKARYPIHPDFEPWSRMHPPINRAMLPVMQTLMGLLFTREKSTAELRVERKPIPADGANLRALLYSPIGLEGPAPLLIDYHGGGFVFPAAPYHYELARAYALRAGCRVLFVDYRLAPKHPFPTAPEDAYAAYVWALGHAEELGIDRGRVAVAGDSAGGTLATVVGLMAAERGMPLFCAQMLIYPAVGLSEGTESMRQFTDTPMCNSRDAKKYDELYMPDPSAGKPEYAAPLGAPSLDRAACGLYRDRRVRLPAGQRHPLRRAAAKGRRSRGAAQHEGHHARLRHRAQEPHRTGLRR